MGNPLGELGGTVTTGIVSASDREIKIDDTKMTLIQTDAAVNPGNSGGGMFNYKGELVGIINAKSSGSGIEGLGFAIPANDAQNVVEQLLEYGYVKGKIYLGLSLYEASTGGWMSTDSSGVLFVYSCEKGYNDDVLKYGDQILLVPEFPIDRLQGLSQLHAIALSAGEPYQDLFLRIPDLHFHPAHLLRSFFSFSRCRVS